MDDVSVTGPLTICQACGGDAREVARTTYIGTTRSCGIISENVSFTMTRLVSECAAYKTRITSLEKEVEELRSKIKTDVQ